MKIKSKTVITRLHTITLTDAEATNFTGWLYAKLNGFNGVSTPDIAKELLEALSVRNQTQDEDEEGS